MQTDLIIVSENIAGYAISNHRFSTYYKKVV